MRQQHGASSGEHQKAALLLELVTQVRQQALRPRGDHLGDDSIDGGAPPLNEGVPTDQHLLRFGIGEANAGVLRAQVIAHRAGDANGSLIQERGRHAQFGLALELVLQADLALVELPAPDVQREVLALPEETVRVARAAFPKGNLSMLHGDAATSVTVTVSEWEVADFFFHYVSPLVAVFLALPLLLVLVVLGMSAASFLRELSPRMVTWRRNAALAGLIIQGLLGLSLSTIYSFALPPHMGAGFGLELLGFMLMIHPNPPRSWSKIRWAVLTSLLLVELLLLAYWIAVLQGVIVG